MKDFFTYYTEIKSMAAPFQTFSIAHLCFLCLMGIIIYALYHRYSTLNTSNKRKFQIYMALYFLIEEAIYRYGSYLTVMNRYGFRSCL